MAETFAHVAMTREIKIMLDHAQREQRTDDCSMDRYKLFVVDVV